MSFDPALFDKELIRATEIAADIHNAVEVRAKVGKQAGMEYLLGKCPRCNTQAALSGEGKHLCKTCSLWLKYVRT